jgi:hypothetical protein
LSADWRSSCTSCRRRHLEEHQPAQADRNHGGKHEQRRQQPRRPESARLQRGHFTVVVQRPERQNHRKQHADRHDHRQIHDRAERDQIENHVPAVLIVGGLAEHPRELVGEQIATSTPVTATQVCTTSRRT